jgi:hypothetical protein
VSTFHNAPFDRKLTLAAESETVCHITEKCSLAVGGRYFPQRATCELSVKTFRALSLSTVLLTDETTSLAVESERFSTAHNEPFEKMLAVESKKLHF